MPLKLVFLGRLESVAGEAERTVDTVTTLAELLSGFAPALAGAVSGERVRVAVNGRLVNDRAAQHLRDGDEVAFLPPVSGG
ncbi:MAG TPA: MoaD/ThiS family protein [Novosphingobium sp.]|nr:MoaD/ThiS family protein [Novosphingobium sp.]